MVGKKTKTSKKAEVKAEVKKTTSLNVEDVKKAINEMDLGNPKTGLKANEALIIAKREALAKLGL